MRLAWIRSLRWLMFSVLVGLAPIAFGVIHLYVRGDGYGLRDAFSEMVIRGDLFLLSAILCAAAIGELLTVKSGTSTIIVILLGGVNTLILLFSSLCFAMLRTSNLEGAVVPVQEIFRGSSIVFVSAVVNGIFSVFVGSLDD